MRRFFFISLVVLLGLTIVPDARAHNGEEPTDRPDSHAPIGVMGEHNHETGEWMLSYRYMYMDMNENYAGTKKQTVAQAAKNYMLSPVRMSMEMHMFGAMYGLSDETTLMVMVPWVIKDMEHRRRTDNAQFSARSAGVGDVKLSAMHKLDQYIGLPIHANFGLSIPSGSINRRDRTIAGANQLLSYPMQLGSGTNDIFPGLTYRDELDDWSWGAQGLSTIRFGKNSRKYRLGNRYDLTAWLARRLTPWASTSVRLDYNIWGNITGQDPGLNPAMIQTNDPNTQGGDRLDLLFGLNLIGQKGIGRNHRLALEFGFPVYQDLDGPQLGAGFQGTFGWQYAW